MTNEDSYKSGQRIYYHEPGEVDEVEVLQNKSNADWIAYELKTIRVVQESRIFKPSKAGEKFSCEKRRVGGGVSGLWHLLDE